MLFISLVANGLFVFGLVVLAVKYDGLVKTISAQLMQIDELKGTIKEQSDKILRLQNIVDDYKSHRPVP